MTNVLENENERPPGQKWDLEYQLEHIHQAVNDEDFDRALELVEQGLAETKEDAEYQERFTNALKEIEVVSPPPRKPLLQKDKAFIAPQGNISAFELTDIKGIGPSIAEKLHAIGVHTPDQLSIVDLDTLSQIKGISVNSAQKFITSAQNLVENAAKYSSQTQKDIPSQQKSAIKDRPTLPKKHQIHKKTAPIGEGLTHFIADESLSENQSKEKSSKDSKVKFPEPKENFFSDPSIPQAFPQEKEVCEHRSVLEKGSSQPKISLSPQKTEDPQEDSIKDEKTHSVTKEDTVQHYADFTIPKQVPDLNSSQNKYSHPQKNISENKPPLQKGSIIPLPSPEKKPFRTQDLTKLLSKNEYYECSSWQIPGSDLLVVKSFEVAPHQNIVLILPITIDTEQNCILVSESAVELPEIDVAEHRFGTFTHTFSRFKDSKSRIFHSIITKQAGFEFLRKFLRLQFTLEVNTLRKEVYLHSGMECYKIVVSPLFLSVNKVAFKEKRIPYAYQRHSEIHFSSMDHLERLLTFIEQKEAILLQYAQDMEQKSDRPSNEVFLDQVRLYSIPFVIIGLFVFILSIPLYNLMSNLWIGLSITLFIVFLLMLGYLYYTNLQSSRNHPSDSSLPITQDDIELLKRDLSPSNLQQFVYEYFGKRLDISIEDESVQSPPQELSPTAKPPLDEPASSEDLKKDANSIAHRSNPNSLLVQKYSDLLED